MNQPAAGGPGLPRVAIETNRRLVRRTAWLLAALAAADIALWSLARGRAGAIGAVIGVVVVVAFFGADLLALRWTRRSKPGTVVAVVVLLYFVKLMLLVLMLEALRTSLTFDGASLVGTVIVGAAAAVAAGLFLSARMRVPYVVP